ncbi:MAG: hypothetical protein FJ147_12265 [Deltaproteobacteria bacterium]|nr:hypothetical protein [Deltaproteobacteria bacterium]
MLLCRGSPLRSITIAVSCFLPPPKQLLGGYKVDLLITDIRLENDDDEKDVSGLTLAKAFPLSIPKIILTGFPSVNLVREAFRDSAAVDFVAKSEGDEELLKAIHSSLLRNVFVVHGHDEGTLQTITGFLEKLGLFPVVLRDLPNRGQTVIQKLEDATNVAFAVVLLTPDDFGGAQGDTQSTARARENVIFELGYFVAKLGSRKVCALHKASTSIPSDYQGVLYISIDIADGTSWQLSLAREMKAAGLNIDLNRLA